MILFCCPQVEAINEKHHHPSVFPDFELPELITATTEVEEATRDAALVIVCLPAQLTPDFLEQHRDVIPKEAILVITCKGLYLKTKQLLSVPILEVLQRDQPLTFLSGAFDAEEALLSATMLTG